MVDNLWATLYSCPSGDRAAVRGNSKALVYWYWCEYRCLIVVYFDKNTIEILSFWLEDFYFLSGEINLLTCFVVFKI